MEELETYGIIGVANYRHSCHERSNTVDAPFKLFMIFPLMDFYLKIQKKPQCYLTQIGQDSLTSTFNFIKHRW